MTPKTPTTPPSRLQEMFDRAMDQPPSGRDAWLAAECRGDEALRAELASLVAAAADAPAFLERPAADVELEGRRAGAWRIESLISSGGMGDVHRAVRAEGDLPWRVALKVLKRDLDADAFVRRFEAERRTLATLAHPNIVALIDAGTLEDGRPFLATELVEGLPIDRHCDERRLGLAERVRLVLAVCEAVAHAHQRLVVHCDLKPGNVLVTAEGAPKLLDFGIARLLTEAQASTPGHPWTAGYASPEQVQGGAIGCASDVFGLGVLLRVVATGVKATESMTEAATRALGRDLTAIVRKATAIDPEQRYPSAEQLAADLRAWLENRPVAARGAGAIDRFAKLVRRNRLASAASLVAVVSLAFGAFATIRRLQESRNEARLGWGAHAQAVSVSRFLEELVLEAGSKDPVALAAVLDRAAARLEDVRLAPEEEGRMRAALGTLYLEVGRGDQARAQLQRALTLAKTHRGFGREDVRRIEALLNSSPAR